MRRPELIRSDGRAAFGAAIAADFAKRDENPDRNPKPDGENGQNQMQNMIRCSTQCEGLFLAMRAEAAFLFLAHGHLPLEMQRFC